MLLLLLPPQQTPTPICSMSRKCHLTHLTQKYTTRTRPRLTHACKQYARYVLYMDLCVSCSGKEIKRQRPQNFQQRLCSTCPRNLCFTGSGIRPPNAYIYTLKCLGEILSTFKPLHFYTLASCRYRV